MNEQFSPNYQPRWELYLGLLTVEGALVAIALVLGPALIAGSLAGEKERGDLALLLTTCVSAREIVTGRLIGKLSQLAMVLAAGVPALVLTAALAGFGPLLILVFLLLPTAVGFGGGGLARAASVLSRRGRDALLTIYLVDLFLMLTPLASMLGLPRVAFDWVSALNPFVGLDSLVESGDVTIVLTSAGLWTLFGVVGTGPLRGDCGRRAWRCRTRRAARAKSRRGFVPPINEKRPMVWKELFVEKVATLGRFGSWIGYFLVAGLLLVSVGLTLVIDVDIYIRHETDGPTRRAQALQRTRGSIGRLAGVPDPMGDRPARRFPSPRNENAAPGIRCY